jgi:phosphate/phosphite/phosphonate ABC transporter binding protein
MLHLDDVIGTGGFGTVYRGRMRSEDGLVRRVAIKVLSPKMSRDTRAVARFRDEARLLALVDHPGLVPVYALNRIENRWAVVMGYVDGFELYDALAQGPVPPGATREIGIQVAETLAALWSHPHPETGEPLKVIHRDVKPHNMMIDRNLRVRLLDLGVASAEFEARESSTLDGEVAGTLAYMSPQRWARRDDGHAGDVYALGASLVHLLTGRLPRQAGASAAEHAVLLDELRADVCNDPFFAIIERAMTWDSELRPTADALAAQLRALDVADAAGLEAWARTVNESRTTGTGVTGNSQRHLLGTHDVETQTFLTSAHFFEPMTENLDVATATYEAPTPDSSTLFLRVGGLAVALAVLTALGIWWLQPPSEIEPNDAVIATPPPPAGPPVALLLTPSVQPATIRREHEPIRLYLERELDRPVVMTVAASYEDVSRRLLAGEAQFAQLPHRIGMHTRGLDPRVTPIATKQIDGSTSVDGYLVVSRDEEASTIADLVGSTFCYSDPMSNTGYKLPRTFLVGQGFDPEVDFVTHMSGDHEKVLWDIVNGVCRVGGTFSGNYITADQRDVPVARLRILALTGRVPHDTIWAGPETEPDLTDALRLALLGFDPMRDAGVAVVGTSERISGYSPPTAETVEPLPEPPARQREPAGPTP